MDLFDDILTLTFLVSLLAAGVRLATPLLLAAIGEAITERSGVLNIGIEGVMLMGALVGYLATVFSGNPWVGAVAALGAGVVASSLHGYLSAFVGADQIISGLATNLLALGIATFAMRTVFGLTSSPAQANTFDPLAIPVLSGIPVVGDILFNQHPWVYISWLLVPVCYVALSRTAVGLEIGAVGENPLAAEAAGVGVQKVRFLSVLAGGALAGLAGMTLPLSHLGLFREGMVAGRGFIAIAIVTLGRWSPIGVLGGALLFGIADALQFRLQTAGLSEYIPNQVLFGAPYLLALIVVATSAGKRKMPSKLAVPYRGGELG